MDFPQSGRISAGKFLEYFLSKQQPFPSHPDDPLPVSCSLDTVAREEIEGVSFDISRTLLTRFSCPGLLNYNITAAAVARLMSAIDSNDDDAQVDQYKSGKYLAYQTVLTVIQVCEEWMKDLPRLTCSRRRPEFSLHSIKNTRRKMEDRHSICVDVNTLYSIKDLDEDQSIFGVFDGHVGVDAAVYASVHVHHNIIHHPTFISDPPLAIRDGIMTTDERFCIHDSKTGTTAVVALLRGSKVYVGWVGDSQAMLVRNGEPVKVMEPHKPEREDEQARIEAAGGLVINIGVWRVNGNLSVSRAIGDGKEKKFIIGEPDVVTIDLDGSEDYMVVACDGIWDVVDEEELKDCMNGYFINGGTKGNAAKHLVEFARDEGSNDNLTAIIVFFDTFKIPSAPVTGTKTETQVKSESGTEVKNGSGTEVKNGSETEVKNGSGTEVKNGSGTEVKNGSGTEVKNGSGTEVKNGSETEVKNGSD